MQWSKSYLPKETAHTTVLEYVPQNINLGTPGAALNYIERKPGSDFRMNDQVQATTGVDKIEKAGEEERAEQKSLALLAEIQQNAYQEAYQLGLDEGRAKAYEDVSSDIAAKMNDFTTLLQGFNNIKKDILAHNEAHMVKLLYHMASKVAMTHLEEQPDSVVEVLRSALSLAAEEEEVTVQMHPEQAAFIEELRKQSNREFEFLKKVKLEPDPKIQKGGCIVETNYGEIDARIETRLQQLWESLADIVPKVKNKIAG